MNTLGIIIVMALTAVITGFCINWYVGYDYYRSYCDGIISFDRFLEIYECSSNKINLHEGYFTYSYYDEGSFNATTYNFYFSILDTFRYERWRKKIERKEEEAQSKKLMNQMEELWAEDARKLQK